MRRFLRSLTLGLLDRYLMFCQRRLLAFARFGKARRRGWPRVATTTWASTTFLRPRLRGRRSRLRRASLECRLPVGAALVGFLIFVLVASAAARAIDEKVHTNAFAPGYWASDDGSNWIRLNADGTGEVSIDVPGANPDRCTSGTAPLTYAVHSRGNRAVRHVVVCLAGRHNRGLFALRALCLCRRLVGWRLQLGRLVCSGGRPG